MKRIYIKPKMEELGCDNEQFLCASSYSANLDGQKMDDNSKNNDDDIPGSARQGELFFEDEEY